MSGCVKPVSDSTPCCVSVDGTTVDGATIVVNKMHCGDFLKMMWQHYDARLSHFHLEVEGQNVHVYMKHPSPHRAIEMTTIFNEK